MQNDEMQGGRIPRNEAYNRYAAMTKDEAQRRRSRFASACHEVIRRASSRLRISFAGKACVYMESTL